jgi:hypothetical protein
VAIEGDEAAGAEAEAEDHRDHDHASLDAALEGSARGIRAVRL